MGLRLDRPDAAQSPHAPSAAAAEQVQAEDFQAAAHGRQRRAGELPAS
jgi:hypothetical protein